MVALGMALILNPLPRNLASAQLRLAIIIVSVTGCRFESPRPLGLSGLLSRSGRGWLPNFHGTMIAFSIFPVRRKS